jgi:DNA processing protein
MSATLDACATCLRRGYLVGAVAPWVAAALADRERLPAGLLALPDEDLVAAVCRTSRARAAAARVTDGFDAEAAGAHLAEHDVAATCRHGDRYPTALLALGDPPAALFVAGPLERLAVLAAGRVVAIVGTRRPSAYGLEMAHELGRALAAAGLTVVSGLALGIDAAAHRGALEGGGTTIAVLARGPEAAYPRLNRDVYRRVRAAGVVVAEVPPGTPAFRWSFPARNRIMAALAELTLVVEAGEPSGSLITARFAADLGRTVAAVPGRATAARAAGSNGLLRDGAHVVLEPADVLELLLGPGYAPVADAAPDPAVPTELAPQLRAVLDAVETGDDLDAARERTGLPPGELRAALARLELLGLVRRDGLGSYERAATGPARGRPYPPRP